MAALPPAGRAGRLAAVARAATEEYAWQQRTDGPPTERELVAWVRGGTPGWSIHYPDAAADSKPARVGKRFYAKPAGACFYDNGHEARWTTQATMSTASVIRERAWREIRP